MSSSAGTLVADDAGDGARPTAGLTGTEPIDQRYEADLLGNIQQALAGLQGFDVMALELIQNADDAGAAVMRFDVTDAGLHVWNSEQFSSCGLTSVVCDHLSGDAGPGRPCNFHAISRMGSRSKIHVGSQIGRFGIGFVSVYQVTDSPLVRSRDIEMRLDPYTSTSPTRRIAPVDGTEFVLSWADAPSPTRKALNASPTPEGVKEKVAEQVLGVMQRGLFFLRNLQQVELRVDGVLRRTVSIAREAGILTLNSEPGGASERWMVLEADAAAGASEADMHRRFPMLLDLDRSTRVSLAIPIGAAPLTGLLFAYLPTEQSSLLPIHVNADFFPHPNRRSIVLTGEQHDRYWNELLLATAAEALSENFERVRDTLGAKRLWELGSAALNLRGSEAFKVFWDRFSEAAQRVDSAWTIEGKWKPAAAASLPPDSMPSDEQDALADLGTDILHPELRPHWTALSAVGARTLRFGTIVDRMTIRFAQGEAAGRASTALWRAVDRIVGILQSAAGTEAVFARLRNVPFVLDAAGAPASLAALRHPPRGADADLVLAYVPQARFAHPDLASTPNLAAMITTFGFDELAQSLASRIHAPQDAAEVIGTSAHRVRTFYDLLVATASGGAPNAGAFLSEVPLLRTRSSFTSPARGLLPGGFTDPIGHLAVVDVDLMPAAMLDFARANLGVETLSFPEYVRRHLPSILAQNPARPEYRNLMREIALHWRQLDADGGLAALSQTRFIRNRAGSLSRPADVYFYTAALELSLGARPERWVDEDWLPTDGSHARLRDLLESELGLPRRPAIAHLVDRIEEIAEGELTDEGTRPLNLISRHLIERLPMMRDAERVQLERLRDLEWLPASVDGTRIADTWYAPHEVYRPFRASGFASQAPIVDLPIFRSTQVRGLTDLLEFLEMPEEPDTQTVVAHLVHCMSEQVPASDITYQILSERVEKDGSGIERLRGTSFIYVGASRQWLSADEVFWEAPPFRGRWHAASQNMHLRAPLYRLLGVVDQPEPRHYAALLRRLAGLETLDGAELAVHDRCLAVIAEAIEAGTYAARDLLETTKGVPPLVNVDRQTIFAEDAIWLDAEWLAAPFCGGLDDRLVGRPQCSRAAAARIFLALGVTPLSAVARLRLAAEPDGRPAEDVAGRLAERRELLLWLATNPAARGRLREALVGLEVRLTETLLVQAELLTSDPPTRSPAAPQAAFYDASTGILHMRQQEQAPIDWSAAFRDIFVQLEIVPAGEDVRPVIMAAVYVIGANSFAEAQQALRTADYHEPVFSEDVADRGEAFEDQGDEEPGDSGEEQAAEADAASVDDGGGGTSDDDEAIGPAGMTEAVQSDQPDHLKDGGTTSGHHLGAGAPADRYRDVPARSDGPAQRTGSAPAQGEGFGASGGAGRSPDREGPPDQPHGAGHETQSGRRGSEHTADGERQSRRSRLLAYVTSKAATTSQTERGDGDREEAALIDIAAIEAVLRYERAAGREPVEQSHTNPGFDIRSAQSSGGGARLIEVKGLATEWNARGIKLSSVQFEMAQQHPEQFWIYVVENARDLERQKVHAIANPFSKVSEYWFDHGWQATAEEKAEGRYMNLAPGVRLRHRVWGIGTVTKVEQNGSAVFVTINFPIDGTKNIPFNSMLSFVG